MEEYAAPPGERSTTIRVFLGTFARYFLMDLPFKKITYERDIAHKAAVHFTVQCCA